MLLLTVDTLIDVAIIFLNWLFQTLIFAPSSVWTTRCCRILWEDFSYDQWGGFTGKDIVCVEFVSIITHYYNICIFVFPDLPRRVDTQDQMFSMSHTRKHWWEILASSSWTNQVQKWDLSCGKSLHLQTSQQFSHSEISYIDPHQYEMFIMM